MENSIIDSEYLYSRVVESELFSRRFGSFSKSDYEILMFTVYLDSLSGDVRDYDISVALGITESKVRNLRVKSQLVYPKEIKWIDILSEAITNGYYDQFARQITITIEDPSARNYIKDLIEKNGCIVNISMNNKQLTLPIESFFMIASFAENDVDRTIKEMNRVFKEERIKADKIEKNSITRRFIDNSAKLAEHAAVLLTIWEMGRPIIEAVLSVIR